MIVQVFASLNFEVCVYYEALNRCIIFLSIWCSIWCIEVNKILSLKLELFGIDVKGRVGHRGMTPAVEYMF